MAAYGGKRLYYLDYLRAFLIGLVVLYHIAGVYSVSIPGYVQSSASSIFTEAVLVLFPLYNFAWFLGAFFLVSGYLSVASLVRKGPWRFAIGRIMRLGIPLAAYSLIMNPLASYISVFQITRSFTLSLTWQSYAPFIGLGVFWFVALLLGFDLLFAAYYTVRGRRWGTAPQARPHPIPKYRWIAVFVLLLAIAEWLITLIIPLGSYFLFLPVIGYLPQYISFFIVGVVAARNGWFSSAKVGMARVLAAAMLVSTATLFPLALSGGDNAFTGGLNVYSFIYALWGAVTAVGMCFAIIVLFRSFLNRDGRFRGFLYEQSYAVYFIHIVVIAAATATVLQWITTYPVLEFLAASAVILPVCWAAAYLVRKIPFVDRVL